MELMIYMQEAGPRAVYVMDMLFCRLLPCAFRLTHDRSLFLSYSGPKLNYSRERLGDEEAFLPAGPLLEERGIRAHEPGVFHHDGLPAFFRLPLPGADLPFDLPALIFFLLSRYEEYLPFEADVHGRFPASASLAARGGFLRQPIVQQWSSRLGHLLKRRFPEWNYLSLPYRFQPTYDIDIPWAYRHRGFVRQIGGSIRSVLRREAGELAARVNVLRGRQADPYDTFDYLEALHERLGLAPKFFFLLSDPGRYDPNPRPGSKAYRALLSSLSSRWESGIHPSYYSMDHPSQLRQETARFREITGQSARSSRQHYLRLRFPETYRLLTEAGIQADHSMGYADQPGFRAGIALPFAWYDLERECVGSLIVHPFQVMDVTLRSYMGLNPDEAIAAVLPMIKAVRDTGGTFCTLWHNSSFSETGNWSGWRSCYERIVKEAATAPGVSE